MESHQRVGRKRKQSSSPLTGTLTRSKSQIYSHLNRSGRFRTDTAAVTRCGTHRPLPNAATDSPNALPPRTTNSPIPTRLDLRRVFSKPLVIVAEQEEKKEAVVDCEVNPNLEFGGELRWKRPHGEGVRVGLGGDCVDEEVIQETPNLSVECGEKLGFLEHDVSPTLPKRDQLIDEENVQTTPPDADILAAREDGQIRLNGLESEDHCTVMPSSTGSPRVVCGVESNLHIPDKKADFVPRRKLALNPCARLKVFKTPSSVSYRRLLPYLLGIAKDSSCALELKSGPKIETVLEEKSSIQSQVPLARDGCINMSDLEGKTVKPMLHTASDEVTGDGSVEEKFPCDVLAGDSTNHIPCDPSSVLSSSNNAFPAADSQNGMPSPSSSPQGDSSHVDQVSSDKSISSALVPDSAVSVTDVASKALQSCSNGDHTTNAKTSEDAITVYQSTSPVTALTSSEPSSVSPTKGILRRNPRGCRGLCTCLNCATFRLHAEKAFEFSRNQLQDTEEVVLQLTKELSQLRTVLEMPLCDSNSQAAFKADQIKEVCASASKAEEVARTRLKEMSEDLFVHCRIKCLQRPRVNFAIQTEEKGSEREKPI